jgi:uncharacterized protein YfaS (alpha-2-macroglobulin family)
MKKNFALQLLWLLCAILILITSCSKKKPHSKDSDFAQYISAYTSGIVPQDAKIRIRLVDAFAGEVNLEEPIQSDLLSFSPSIEGKLFWLDKQTLEFRPEAPLSRGTTYQCTFHLGKLIDVDQDHVEFIFSFTAMNQAVSVHVTAISQYTATDLRWMYLKGELLTADKCEYGNFDEVLEAKEGGRAMKIIWQHAADGKVHTFTIDSLERGENALQVELHWDGSKIGADQKGDYTQTIPALGDFSPFFSRVVQQPDQYVVIHFSDPLLPDQNMNGLVSIDGVSGLRVSYEMNEMKVFPDTRLSGAHTITIFKGIKNIMGFPLLADVALSVNFEDLKPAIVIPDENDVILPSSNGMVFPFQAVNFSAVDVRVLRIYENNIPQFLQINELNGSDEMRRVGRVVAKKTIPLNTDASMNLGEMNWFYLDLKEIITPEPGAIYRVELYYNKKHSLYSCGDASTPDDGMKSIEENEDEPENEETAWDTFNSEYWDDGYDWNYDYSQTENPCNEAYYKSKNMVAKNILASDIGLLSKRASDGSVMVCASNLVTAEPIDGATIEILNYQQQRLAKGRTNADGVFEAVGLKGVPFLVVATQRNQKSYLKMNTDNALSLSAFEVSGTNVQKGLKGYIYGERGVWRPGDTLFLSFMLHDAENMIPKEHPVQLELKNPQGQIVEKKISTKSQNGLHRFTCITSSAAVTGNYEAVVRVGGATFSKTIKIETIKPNRLKLNLNFGPLSYLTKGQNLEGELSARWLHGATAKNLKANVTVVYSTTKTSFDKYKDFIYDSPIERFQSEEKTIFDGYLNEQGLSRITMNNDIPQNAPGMLNANFSVKVFEEGGDFSIDRFSIPFAPYDVFAGVRLPKGDASRAMLLTDQDHQVDVVCMSADGKPVSGRKFTWSFYKVSWRWWWQQGSGNSYDVVNTESSTPISTGESVTGNDGKGKFNIRVNYPDWGRYLVIVKDEGGHTTGSFVYIDWPGWAGKARNDGDGGGAMFMFNLDKEKYKSGETCQISFEGSGAGRALISIENGTKILKSEWVKVQSGTNTYRFATDKNMAPNAYINISLIQPHKQTANDMPIRSYGIVPLFVENTESHIEPTISMPDELAPDQSFTVSVGEKNGQAMSYTLAIVDEGLLDLTRFKTPDPWNYFYAKEALGVSTYDLYDQVIGAFGVRSGNLLSIGGDENANGKGSKKANRFKPVVIFEGPFTLQKGQRKDHKLYMPSYVGSVRVMVVACNAPAYGNAEKTVPVKKPLMVLATLPRIAGPGEELKLPVNVFAMDPKIRDVKIELETNELFSITKERKGTLHFDQPGDAVYNFGLKVSASTGIGKVKVVAEGGGIRSEYEIEIEVRNPNPEVTNVMQATADAGKSVSFNFGETGVSNSSAVLEVSSFPGINFGPRTRYLLQYPHGCVEQTTSAAFPQIYASAVLDLNESQKAQAKEHVEAAIRSLQLFQVRTGGFAYWPGSSEVSDWATSYVGHFLVEAKSKGFVVPAATIDKWIGYQQQRASSWRPQSGENFSETDSRYAQAYRLYTLALAGKADLGAMNRLKESGGSSESEKWMLASAYALAGQRGTGELLVRGLSGYVASYTFNAYTYGSDLRDMAIVIEAMTQLGMRDKAGELVISLSKRLGTDEWMSTQTTAFGLLAISKYIGEEKGKQVSYRYSLNGKDSGNQTTQQLISTRNLQIKPQGNVLEVKNETGNALFVRLILTGRPEPGSERASQEVIAMNVQYVDMKGQAIDVSRIQQGTDFMALVTVTNPGNVMIPDLALTEVFPSGWEILNSRLEMNTAGMTSDAFDYQDIRDDRVMTYFGLSRGTKKTYKVKLNATYMGRFYLPSISCSSMYNNAIKATTTGQWVEVVSDAGRLANK